MRLSSYFLLILLFTAGGCSLLPEQVDKTKDWSASQLYSAAKESLNDGDYKEAIDYFEKLEARYPFGTYAQQAELEIAYAYYKYDEPDSAIAAADQFIKLYPRNPHVDYAYYMKGLARFPKPEFLEKRLSLDMAQRDPRTARESLQSFLELTRRYPDSHYAADAVQRIIYLRNDLARGEMYAANFYMRKGAYAAAANRAKYIVEHYDRTPSIPDDNCLRIKVMLLRTVSNT